MANRIAIKNRFEAWKTPLIVFGLMAVMMGGFYFSEKSTAQVNTTTRFIARLTGTPAGGMIPAGNCVYNAFGSTRTLDCNISGVNLPAGTSLSVDINGTNAGNIILNAAKSGALHLTTNGGGTVPTITSGSTAAVTNGTTVVLNGTFTAPATPTPTPSVSPTATVSPTPTRTPTPTLTPFPTPSSLLYAPLTGATIGGAMPNGMGQYVEFGTANKTLSVFVRLRLPVGTSLNVMLGTTSIGTITLRADGCGELRLTTANGGTVPMVAAGDVLTIKNGETTVLSGTFRVPGPPPSPSPSPSPTGSPSPSPTVSPMPSPVSAFGGHLTGSQVVPAVTTQGRGGIWIVLNPAGTQIKVYSGFFRLSSNQTTATINGPALAGTNASTIFDLGTIGGTSGRFGVKTFDVTPEQVTALRTGLWYAVISSVNNPAGEIRGQIRSHSSGSSFAGQAAQDIAVYRQNTGKWYIQNGTSYDEINLGGPNAKAVSADYDGDGITDAATFANGIWTIRRSSDGGTTTKQFGLAGDIPVRGDFDGDGQNDVAIFRNGTWYIENSDGSGYKIVQFGFATDTPIAADFDGDGKDDIAVFRSQQGDWYYSRSSDGVVRGEHFGALGDIPIAGDFDGDGAADISVYRQSTGVWYAYRSSDGTFDIRAFGMNGDVPAAGDYDGDNITDIAVFRRGVWYIWRSTDSTMDVRFFGIEGDIPTVNR